MLTSSDGRICLKDSRVEQCLIPKMVDILSRTEETPVVERTVLRLPLPVLWKKTMLTKKFHFLYNEEFEGIL